MTRSARPGLSLTEVLVVVCILALIAGLLLPAVRRVREPAARMRCANNLKQVMLAVHSYESTDRTPPVGPPPPATLPPGCFGPGASPDARLSWMVAILPFLEQGNLYRQFDPQSGYAGNLLVSETPLTVFQCPDGMIPPPASITHYVALSGLGSAAAGQPGGTAGNGFMGYDRATTFLSITDGLSNTIAVMETRLHSGPWARGGASTLRGFDPDDVPPIGDGLPFGGHNDMTQAARADGSVRAIRASVAPQQLAAAVTIAGGESPDLDW